jgi:hypothetical protein
MSEHIESKLALKLEHKLGPVLARLEVINRDRIWIRSIAALIFVITLVWWPCRLFHPHFSRFGFLETACLDIIVVGPSANLVLGLVLFVSAVRSGWQDRGWILVVAIFCALTPWIGVASIGLVDSPGLFDD